jgi:hypothetical protein
MKTLDCRDASDLKFDRFTIGMLRERLLTGLTASNESLVNLQGKTKTSDLGAIRHMFSVISGFLTPTFLPTGPHALPVKSGADVTNS